MWMQTLNGHKFWPKDGTIEKIDIDDIAHALSQVCRFGGQCKRFYSVGQHSVWVSLYVEEMGGGLLAQLQGLLHDGAEAYMVDMPTPVKILFPDYKKLEEKLLVKIFDEFKLPHEFDSLVKDADMKALSTEARDLMNDPQWDHLPAPAPNPLWETWDFDKTRMKFIERFGRLTGAIDERHTW